jgi:hypothetical protein
VTASRGSWAEGTKYWKGVVLAGNWATKSTGYCRLTGSTWCCPGWTGSTSGRTSLQLRSTSFCPSGALPATVRDLATAGRACQLGGRTYEAQSGGLDVRWIQDVLRAATCYNLLDDDMYVRRFPCCHVRCCHARGTASHLRRISFEFTCRVHCTSYERINYGMYLVQRLDWFRQAVLSDGSSTLPLV